MRLIVLVLLFSSFVGSAYVAFSHPGSGIVADREGNIYFVDTGSGMWLPFIEGRISKVILIAACAMTILPACKPGDVKVREQDEAAVRAVEQAYDAAWNAGDVNGLVALLLPDAVVVTPFGNVARGRAEIQRLLQQFLAGPGRGSHHTSFVWGVEFVTDNVAVVDAEARIEGLNGPDTPQSFLIHKFTDILVKEGLTWRIAHVRAYVFSVPPPNHSTQH